MLHVHSLASQPVGDAVLRGMFAARKSVFVDLLKWDVPVVDERYEVDQFDDVHATYLIITDASGRHLASTRLLPTLRPHILGDLFPQLCEQETPRGPAVFEITRFCLDRTLRARERRLVRNRLVVAIAEHARANGIQAFTAIAEVAWVQQILSFGWRCAPLGLPAIVNGEMLAALRIDIDADTLSALAQAGLVADAVSTAERELLAA